MNLYLVLGVRWFISLSVCVFVITPKVISRFFQMCLYRENRQRKMQLNFGNSLYRILDAKKNPEFPKMPAGGGLCSTSAL